MRLVNYSFVIALVLMALPIHNLFADDYVVCESSRDRRNYCSVNRAYDADIQISRRLSDASCTEGVSWGRDNRGVWVDNGCRAEFRVIRARGGYNGGYNSGYNDSYHGGISGSRDPYADDRERELQRERDRNRELREQLEREKSKGYAAPVAPQERCPAGFVPGNHRCSDAERRKGCKDMRMPGGTTCSSPGWGYK